MRPTNRSAFTAPPGTAFIRQSVRGPNGRPLPHFPATEGRSKRLTGLGMVAKDLERAEKYLQALLRLPDDDDAELRWHGAVMAYGRCFADAAGRGFTLDKQHLKTLGAQEHRMHGRAMSLRHQYVAHSGINDEQRARAIVVVSGPLDAPVVEQAIVLDLTVLRPQEAELRDFVSLVQALQTRVGALFNETEIAVVEHYAAKTHEQLSSLLQAQLRSQAQPAP